MEHPNASAVLESILELSQAFFAERGIDLGRPIADGGGPSSTFTASVFAGSLLGKISWGAHVAVRVPDGAYNLAESRLAGPHLGIFRQIFFSLPGSVMQGIDSEELTRALVGRINTEMLGHAEQLVFRPYQWNANSTRMVGEAREVNLASGPLMGMEVTQLNRIEQVGGIRLAEPCYLIVLGVDRMTYQLSLQDYFDGKAQHSSVADFYRLEADHAELLTRLHSNILYSDSLRSGLADQLDSDLNRLVGDLNRGAPIREETLARFRAINILLETLFMTRNLGSTLRQGYIGRIGDAARQIAAAIVANPEDALPLVTQCQVESAAAAREHTEQLLRDCARNTAAQVASTIPAPDSLPEIPESIIHWHADYMVGGIDQDLPGILDAEQRSELAEWIRIHHSDAGAAVRGHTSQLPLGFTAIRLAEERTILQRDLMLGVDELRSHMSDVRLIGGTGDQRHQRIARLSSILLEHKLPLPAELPELLPYIGLEQLFYSSRIFERTAPALLEAWFASHLPRLQPLHTALRSSSPPDDAVERNAWMILRLEQASRYLLVRAGAGKPLWQDPYGARRILNRELQPLLEATPMDAAVLEALLDGCLEGTTESEASKATVRNYLERKLLEPA